MPGGMSRPCLPGRSCREVRPFGVVWGRWRLFLSHAGRVIARLARSLAAMLTTKQIEVCAGLEQAPGDTRAEAYRAAIDRGALMVALWAEDDHTDPAYVDYMLYAQRNGRLFAVAVGSARLPGMLGGDASVAGALDDRDAQQRQTLSDLIAQRVSRGRASKVILMLFPPGLVAEETKAFLRVQRQRSANALVRFLREYPEGIFERVVRDQLDAETRPQYQPDRPLARGWWSSAHTKAEL